MSDSTPQPGTAVFPPAAAGARSPARWWIVLTAVAVAALIIGASGGVSALLLAGWRKPVDREFTVSVFLDADVDAAQKAAVRAELEKLPSRDGVSFESREQAFANFKEIWKDQPERIAGVRADALPESFRLTVVAPEFDCSPIRGIRALPGVEKPMVVMAATRTKPGGEVGCY